MSRRFSEVRPPPNADDLPEDLRKQMEEEVPTQMTELEMAALNGELEETRVSESIEIPETLEIKNKVTTLQKKGLDALNELLSEHTQKQFDQLAEYAKLDKWNITFDDGATRTFKRVGINQEQTEQVKDLQNRLETIMSIEGNSGGETELAQAKREKRKLEKDQLDFALIYLRDTITNKPITKEQIKHVTQGVLPSIVGACVLRTVHDIVDPKV